MQQHRGRSDRAAGWSSHAGVLPPGRHWGFGAAATPRRPAGSTCAQLHTPGNPLNTHMGARGKGTHPCGCPAPPPPRNSPSPGQPTPGVVKKDKSSGGSVDTTKTRSGPQRVRMSSGERPMGAAKGKQRNAEALCQPPPPPRAVDFGNELAWGLSVCSFRCGTQVWNETPGPGTQELVDSRIR